jgi:hypothetical protein
MDLACALLPPCDDRGILRTSPFLLTLVPVLAKITCEKSSRKPLPDEGFRESGSVFPAVSRIPKEQVACPFLSSEANAISYQDNSHEQAL